MKREFYVDTPAGKLHIHAKYEVDHPEDYPGVYIDLQRNGGDDYSLFACIEFDSRDEVIQAMIHANEYDEFPTHIIKLGDG